MIPDFSKHEQDLYNYVGKFCFPRLAGTEGEQKAVELTAKTFEEIGFQRSQIEKERFDYSTFYSSDVVKIFSFISLVLIGIIVFLKYLFPFLIIIILLVMIILFLSVLRTLRYPEKETTRFWGFRVGKIRQATNIFVKIPSKSTHDLQTENLIVSAHLDSKSQSYKTMWRIIFSNMWLLGTIAFIIFYVLFLLDYFEIFKFITRVNYLFFEIGSWISTAVVGIANLFLINLKIGNESPGALDNATGMALVFKLSSFFKDSPLEHFNLWFCQFSAEEVGTMGSRDFLDKREKIFVKGETFQFNFDMISCAGHDKKNRIEYLKSYGLFPKKKIAPVIASYLHQAAQKENLKIHGFNATVGAHTDSIPFHLRKFDSIDLTTLAAVIHAHTKGDTLDRVDPKVLTETYIIVKKAIELMDEDFSKYCKCGKSK